MEKTIWIGSLSGPNRKSKTCAEPFDFAQDKLRRSIQNPKWAGLFAIVVALTVCGARAEAQQPTKVPRIGVLAAISHQEFKTNA